MSRELKFRAFNKEVKCMFYWDLSIAFRGTKKIFSDVMQYTGIKDSVGKEIYEGDILEFPRNLGIAYVVCDGFRFCVESPGSLACDYESQEVLEQCKVIGNIYEDAKLLES